MPNDDFAFEHAPGLPGPLPPGEDILWQGKPDAARLAIDSLALRWVAGYFALLALWRAGASLADLPFGLALATAIPPVVLGLLTCAILWAFSWLQAKATIYTVTTARVILRVGAALQVTLQVPYAQMANIALDERQDGTGTLAFEPKTDGGRGLSYFALWPHVRPWHLRVPEPAFRSIQDAQAIAFIVADAAETALAQPKVVRAAQSGTTAPQPLPLPAE